MRSATRRKTGKEPAYLVWIRTLPCVVCEKEGFADSQWTATEAAHVGDRGMSQKCGDLETIPLCALEHHREGPESAHKLGKRFWEVHGLDRDALVASLQKEYEEQIHGNRSS